MNDISELERDSSESSEIKSLSVFIESFDEWISVRRESVELSNLLTFFLVLLVFSSEGLKKLNLLLFVFLYDFKAGLPLLMELSLLIARSSGLVRFSSSLRIYSTSYDGLLTPLTLSLGFMRDSLNVVKSVSGAALGDY